MFGRSVLFLILLVSVSSLSFAGEKTLIYFGGGGEPPGPSTIFDGSFTRFMDFSHERSWSSSVYFDGGHAKSEKTAKNILGSKPATFSSANYNKKIQQTIRDIQSGKIKSGDQLMLILDTHGNQQGQEQIHTVEATNGSVSVDKLIELKNLAEAKGIKLALVDTSCFGGNSMKLAGPKTCVISLSLAHRMANSEDAESLAAAFRDTKYKNLEEAFLEGRKGSDGDSQPQISSPQGLALQEALSELDKTLYDYEDLKTEIDESNTCRAMTPTENSAKIVANHIQDFKRIMHEDVLNSFTPLEREHIESLKVKMDNYAKIRAPLEQFLTRDSSRRVCVKDKSYCMKVSELDEQKEYILEELKSGKDVADNKAELRDIKFMEKRNAYKNWAAKKKSLQKNIDEIEDLLPGIAKDERALYDELYRSASSTATGPNPCRDFTL